MDDIKARVAYLQGLAEGLHIEASSAEGRVLSSVIDVLGEFARQISDLADEQSGLSEYVDDLDQDLSCLEEAYYDDGEESIRFIPATEMTPEADVEMAGEYGGTGPVDVGEHSGPPVTA